MPACRVAHAGSVGRVIPVHLVIARSFCRSVVLSRLVRDQMKIRTDVAHGGLFHALFTAYLGRLVSGQRRIATVAIREDEIIGAVS